jgi:hypothetical protein
MDKNEIIVWCMLVCWICRKVFEWGWKLWYWNIKGKSMKIKGLKSVANKKINKLGHKTRQEQLAL